MSLGVSLVIQYAENYRGRLVHSVLLINASIMQIQTMTQIQTKNPAAYFNTRPRL